MQKYFNKVFFWQQVELPLPSSQTSDSLQGLSGHSLNLINDKVAVFGGVSNFIIPKFFYIDDSNTSMTNPQIDMEVFGEEEDSGFTHKCVVLNNRLYILMNVSDTNKDSVFILDPKLNKAFGVKLDSMPSCFRINYSAVAYKNKIYLFGGLNDHSSPINTLEVFDATTYRWSLVKTFGKNPEPRHSHTATIIGDCMYVLGGTDEPYLVDAQPMSDLYKLDMDNMYWTPIMATGSLPRNLAYHYSEALDDNRICSVWHDKDMTIEDKVLKVSTLSIDTFEWNELLISDEEKAVFRIGCAFKIYRGKILAVGGINIDGSNSLKINIMDLEQTKEVPGKKSSRKKQLDEKKLLNESYEKADSELQKLEELTFEELLEQEKKLEEEEQRQKLAEEEQKLEKKKKKSKKKKGK